MNLKEKHVYVGVYINLAANRLFVLLWTTVLWKISPRRKRTTASFITSMPDKITILTKVLYFLWSELLPHFGLFFSDVQLWFSQCITIEMKTCPSWVPQTISCSFFFLFFFLPGSFLFLFHLSFFYNSSPPVTIFWFFLCCLAISPFSCLIFIFSFCYASGNPFCIKYWIFPLLFKNSALT